MSNFNAISTLLDCDATDANAVINAFAEEFGAAVDARVAAQTARLPLTDVLTVDFDVDSGTTGATPTATGLAIAVGASKTYIVEIALQVTATTNGGVEVSFTAPGSSTFDYFAHINPSDNVLAQRTNGAVANPINYIAVALSHDPIIIKGVLTTDSAGTFTILGAQDTSHADNTLIEIGSYMILTPVV